METRKILGLIFSLVFLGAFAFVLSWGIINFNKVKEGMSGTELYTQEDLNNAYQDGYDTALENKDEYDELISGYRDTITTLNDNISQLNSQITNLKNSNQDCQNQIANLNYAKANLESEIVRLNENKSDNEKTIDSLNSQITSLNSQITNLNDTIDTNEITINSLNNQITSLNTQIAGLNQTITNNDKIISDLRININELNAEIERLTNSNQSNQTEINILKNQVNTLNEQIVSLDNQNKEYLATIDSLEAEISQLTAEKNNLIIENTNYYNTISSLNNQIVNLQNVNTQLENTNTLHLNTISSLNTQIASLNQQISDITYQSQNNNSTISSLNAKIKELEESVQYYENYIASLENDNQVVATFEYDGSVYNIQMVNKGSTLAVATPQDTNYVIFNGWTVDGTMIDLSTYIINENTKIVADLTYKYDVVFKVDDTVYNSQIITNNDCPILPENPTKSGYEFDGWSTDGVSVIENVETKKITSNTTYQAVFTKLHSVKFLYEDITKSTQTIRNGASATFVNVDNTMYKIFNGWKVNGSIVDVATYKITTDTTFVADITYRYDVVYKVDDTPYNSQIITANNYPNLPTNPTKDGYEFEGWSLNGTDIINTSTLQITNNTTYYAVFSKLYNVSFVYEGTTIATQSVKENGKAKAVNVDNTAYKVFNGWKLNGEFVNISDCVITQNTTFEADITYKYDVVFMVDGTIHNSQIVVKNGCAILPNNPTKSGYVFDGWSLGGSTIITDIASRQVVANTTYYAVFTKVYSVKFVSENLTIETQSVREGSFAQNVVIQNTDYKQFNGWKVDNTIVNISSYVINADTVFIADISYSYDVKFMVDGSAYNSQIVKANGLPTIPSNPTKSGYEFDGWTLNGTIVNPSQIVITQNVSYVAQFTKLHTVKFMVDNSVFATQTIRNNNKTTMSSIPTKSGFDFVGWSLNNTNTVNVSDITITSNITFYAIFKESSGLFVDGVMTKTWEQCVSEGIVTVSGDTITDANLNTQAELRIPSSITTIGENAFYVCRFTKIVLPDSITSIGKRAFASMYYLTEINIPKNITILYDSTFEGAKLITNITIPSGVTSIGAYCFSDCYALETITIPAPVTSIAQYAFEACKALTSCVFESNTNLTTIKEGAFSYCTSLTSISLPDSVTTLASRAFMGCSKLVNAHLPASLTLIDDRTFYACSALTTVNIPYGVTYIDSYAFDSCTSLKTIWIPSTVVEFNCWYDDGDLDAMPFEECENLTIYCQVSSKPSSWDAYWNWYGYSSSEACPVKWGYTYEQYLTAIGG